MQQPIWNNSVHVFNVLLSGSVLLYPAHNPVLHVPIPEFPAFPVLKELSVGGDLFVSAQAWQVAAQQAAAFDQSAAKEEWAAIVPCKWNYSYVLRMCDFWL